MKTLREDVEAFLATVRRRHERYGRAYYADDLAAGAFVAIGNAIFNFINNNDSAARVSRKRCGLRKSK